MKTNHQDAKCFFDFLERLDKDNHIHSNNIWEKINRCILELKKHNKKFCDNHGLSYKFYNYHDNKLRYVNYSKTFDFEFIISYQLDYLLKGNIHMSVLLCDLNSLISLNLLNDKDVLKLYKWLKHQSENLSYQEQNILTKKSISEEIYDTVSFLNNKYPHIASELFIIIDHLSKI